MDPNAKFLKRLFGDWNDEQMNNRIINHLESHRIEINLEDLVHGLFLGSYTPFTKHNAIGRQSSNNTR